MPKNANIAAAGKNWRRVSVQGISCSAEIRHNPATECGTGAPFRQGAAPSTPPDGGAETAERLPQIFVVDFRQSLGNACCGGSVEAFGWRSRRTPQRSLAQRYALDGAPAEA